MKHIITITDKDITGSEELSGAEPRIAVNAVLFDADGNIALSYMGRYDLYTLPGGGVDSGEDYHAAVKREMWEETGCQCEIGDELGYIIENRHEHDFTQERYYYIAQVAGEKGDLHLTDEEAADNTTVVWLPLEQALKIITEKQDNNYQQKFIRMRDIAALTEASIWFYTHDIPSYDAFMDIKLINQGLSSDKKYHVKTYNGRSFLLRISNITEYDHKKAEFERMQQMNAYGIPMPEPVEFGICNKGKSIYQLLAWCDGENLEAKLPMLSETWYLKDFYIQWIDGVPYKLKAPYDFSFMKKYGKVFKVYDDQDSGNICFGTEDGENKYFVKFAGAPTERSCVSAEEAVAYFKRKASVYKDLAHQNLIKFINAEEIGGGFAVIFEWVDAECMHQMYPLQRKRFMQMPLDKKLKVFDDILDFHAHVARKGYAAIDFYDGSIMYDFNNYKTVICDIDLYEKSPYINNMGRMWGSSRFMSPEEFRLSAVIDEVTNVYTMGAAAYALFGDEQDRSIDKWKLSKELFAVAKKAVSDEREKRQQTIEDLILEWRAANRQNNA